MKTFSLICVSALAFAPAAYGGNVFVEAESFQSAGGWVVAGGKVAKRASGLAVLSGAGGTPTGTASAVVNIQDAGHYHVWVRYASYPNRRGPFRLAVLAEGRELADQLFDAEFEGSSARDADVWKSFDVVLPEGEVTLRLSKHENRNPEGSSRLVDCVLLTMDDDLVPNHLHFGAQTFVRVTLGEGYKQPVYLHIFADHYHAPWYQHYHLSRNGAESGVSARTADLLTSGDRTPWCNITPLLYQDSGAMLHITARHTYLDTAEHLRAVFEFATAADEKAIARTLAIDNRPGSVTVYVPPNLLTAENLAHFKIGREIAEATGKLADAHTWPTHGRRLKAFPFFVSATQGKFTDARLAERERKTLDYFGFADEHLRRLPGVWHMIGGSYCRPDVEKMRTAAAQRASEFKQAGGDVRKVAFAALTDEPKGQSLEFMARDPAYLAPFREWLKKLGQSPADLLVADWEAVKPVTIAERDAHPALYYFSQRFRTRALGDFMAVQRKILEAAYGGTFPALANFSDGAIYSANFYAQGVDYFELLDGPDQNAIWGEDWANSASTYQCASYNVDLMRGAARRHGQTIGHHLIAYAGRKPWDVKLKATSELARGVKLLNNYCYGPSWATHSGGPYWQSHLWYAKPESWTANAALTREVGAVEELLLAAMPARAKSALLYSSASDVWAVGGNQAYGFDRMHTWLALTHEQIPVDIVHESQAAAGELDGYQVCYLSGKNLTQAAAKKLKQWVRSGGTLWLSAGAAARDEYNRPLDVLNDLLPAERGECVDLQAHHGSGKYLRSLAAKDHVRWSGGTAEVLSVKQTLTARGGAEVLAAFGDRSAAVVRGTFGKGRIYCAGFLPGLAYIKPALDHRFALEERAKSDDGALTEDEAAMLARSANPWDFPSDVRKFLLTPLRDAGAAKPVECNMPLVDAVYMLDEQGILIPLANYTNRPISQLELTVSVPRPIAHIESAVHGELEFTQLAPHRVRLALPLDNNDFLKLTYP